MVTLHPDPRLNTARADRLAKLKTYEEFYALVEKATAGFNRLKDMKKTIKLVDEAMVNAPDSTKKQIAEMGKELNTQIQEIEEMYMMPEGLKGIQRSSDNLTSTLYRTSYAISSSEGRPNQAAQRMLAKAERETEEALEAINTLIEEDSEKIHEDLLSLYKNILRPYYRETFKAMEPVR